MASGTPSAQVRIPLTGPLLPPPPLLLRLCYLVEKLSGGRKFMRRQKNYKGATAQENRRHTGGKRRKNYPAARAGGPKTREKNSHCQNCRTRNYHSAKNTLFHILIHCETIPYPYTLPKTLSQYIAETIPYPSPKHTLS